MRALARAIPAAAAILLALAAPAPAAEPFDIYGILSLTGFGAFLGNEELQTLQAVAKVANQRGGIAGRQIRFVISDDTSNPRVAVQLAAEILARHVPIMLGPTTVASCKAVAPLFAKGPVQYCFAPGVYPPPGSFSFAAGVSTVDFVVATLRYFRAEGWKRIAIVTSSDATGQEGESVIRQGLALPENKDLSVVQTMHFNITDVSMDAQMSRIKAADPQVIIAWTTGTPFGTVLRSYTNVGLTVPLLTNSGNIAQKQMEQYAAFAPSQLYVAATRYLAYRPTAHPDAIEDAQRLFFATIKQAGINPDTGPSVAWDTGWIVVDAFRQLGPDATSDRLHAYLEQLHGFVGINGTFDFRDGKQRGLTIDSAILVRWDGGKKVWIPVSAPGGAPLP